MRCGRHVQPGMLSDHHRRLQQQQRLPVGGLCQQRRRRLWAHCLQSLQYSLWPVHHRHHLLRQLWAWSKVQRQHRLVRLRYELQWRLYSFWPDLRQQPERRYMRSVRLRYHLRRQLPNRSGLRHQQQQRYLWCVHYRHHLRRQLPISARV